MNDTVSWNMTRYFFPGLATLTIVYYLVYDYYDLVYDYNRVVIPFAIMAIKVATGFFVMECNTDLLVSLITKKLIMNKQMRVTPAITAGEGQRITARSMIISLTFLAITAITILYHFVYHIDYFSIGLIFKITAWTCGLNLIVNAVDSAFEKAKEQIKAEKEAVNVTTEPLLPPPPPPPPIREVYNIQPIKFAGDRITILRQLLHDIPYAPLDGLSVKEAIMSKVTDDSDFHLMKELVRTDIHNLQGLKRFILSARIPQYKVDKTIEVSIQRLNGFALVRNVSQLTIVLTFLEQELYLCLIPSINIIVSLITTGCLRRLPNKKELLTHLVRIDENETDINEFAHHLLKSYDLDEYFCRPTKPVNFMLN